MTLQEIEQGLKFHEERFARMDAEHEKRFKRIEDNLVVQGEILNRIDLRLDRMAASVENHDQQLALMQSAMTALFQRMDAFIRGLERGNGDTPAGGPR